jgi:hypothetical protein
MMRTITIDYCPNCKGAKNVGQMICDSCWHIKYMGFCDGPPNIPVSFEPTKTEIAIDEAWERNR